MLFPEFTRCKSECQLKNWVPARMPQINKFMSSHVEMVPMCAERHADSLFNILNNDEKHWLYLPYGPFSTLDEFRDWIITTASLDDTILYTVCDVDNGHPLGFFGYRQIDLYHGLIEIGHVNFSSVLRRTRAASEALYMLLKNAFEYGFRRCEWRCHASNLPSAKSAVRLGFKFEGCLRQAMVAKGYNRDTFVFSLLDSEWHAIQAGFEAYLSDENFQLNNIQIRPLSDFM
jgi:RimJ/RimL family protein N-acetyltransferase